MGSGSEGEKSQGEAGEVKVQETCWNVLYERRIYFQLKNKQKKNPAVLKNYSLKSMAWSFSLYNIGSIYLLVQ